MAERAQRFVRGGYSPTVHAMRDDQPTSSACGLLKKWSNTGDTPQHEVPGPATCVRCVEVERKASAEVAYRAQTESANAILAEELDARADSIEIVVRTNSHRRDLRNDLEDLGNRVRVLRREAKRLRGTT